VPGKQNRDIFFERCRRSTPITSAPRVRDAPGRSRHIRAKHRRHGHLARTQFEAKLNS
jgi:hypothetical protein